MAKESGRQSERRKTKINNGMKESGANQRQALWRRR
jgi:hypothetical protein